MPGIRATRNEVSDRFPVLGFTVQTGGNPYFEVMLTTDPDLPKEKRNPQNFFSTRGIGPLMAERGEAVYLPPTSVVQRFREGGAEKLFYALATFPDSGRSRVEFLRVPNSQSPYVNLRACSGRGARQVRPDWTARNDRRSGGDYSGVSPADLSWAGDLPRPGAEAISPPAPANGGAPAHSGNGNGNGNGNGARTAPPAQSAALDYNDGFGEMPPVPAETDPGIEGPVPDAPAAAASAYRYAAAQNASPEYPQASRFVAANAGNYRASSSPRTVNRVVIHITDGGASINGPISWFQNPSARVSAHYIVGQDGEVVQMVLHNDVAWHAGSANGDSIGIEHVANTRGLVPTEAEYCASAALVSWLCDQFGIPKDRNHILGHSEADTHTSHTACPNAVWDWDYFMSMVTSGSCMSQPQALATVRAPSERRGGARAMDGEQCFDVNWNDVQLVPQPNNATCWAASAAMVVGWRDQVSIDPQNIAAIAGRNDAFTRGLNPNDRDECAAAWGLSVEPPQNYTVEGFRRLLENYGPLWVGVAVPTGHAVVVTGLAGDGTPQGTFVRYHDPWPPGKGAAFAQRSYEQFMTEYENRMTVDQSGNVNVQILRAADTGGRTIGAGFAQGLTNNFRNGRAGAASRRFASAASAVGTRRAGTFEADEIPLDPGAGGMCIDSRSLAIGDIIVSTTDAFISGAIRWASGSPVSHAMLYIGDGLVVDSTGPGVEVRTLEQALSDATLAVAFRVPNLDRQQALLVKDYAGQQLGHGYNHMGVLEQALFQLTGQRVRVNLGSGSNDRFFCSELIFAAFQEAGAPLTTNPPSWGSPEDLAQLRLNHVLEYVGHLKAPPLSGAQGFAFDGTKRVKPGRTARALDAAQDEIANGMRSEGVTEEEIAQFMANWGMTPSDQTATASSARALEGEQRIQVQRPQVRVLSAREALILRAAWRVAAASAGAAGVLFPALGPLAPVFVTWLLESLPNQAQRHGVTIGVGPNASGFAVAGGSVGAGIVFGADGRIGVYGSVELGAGWAVSLSAVVQMTIVRGSIEEFAGEGVAIVVSGGEGIVGGVAVLFTPAQVFQGVSFQIGIGAGLTPVDVYLSMQQSWAVSEGMAAPARAARGMSFGGTAPGQKRIRPQARGLNDPGEITPDYSQIHSTGAAIAAFIDWLGRELKFRTGVTDTSFFPHAGIAKLRLFDGGGNLVGEGSGFYVGRNRIVTAGHCLVNDDGSRVQGVEVIPGLQGTREPFGGASVGLGGLKPHPQYNPLAYDPSFDIGVITGAPDAPLGMWFEMEELMFSPNPGIITCGYAAVGVDPTIQHMDVDTIRELHNGTFTYAAQVRQGSSGGPVFYVDSPGGSIRAVGLNVTTYDDHQNRGLRLTAPLIAWINSL